MALPDGFLDAARALIRADSVSAKGNRAAIDVLVPLYESAGLNVQQDTWRESIDGAPEAEHTNVIAGPGGTGAWTKKGLKEATKETAAQGGVVFVTHTDTVPGGPKERWTATGKDPHALAVSGDWLIGLGVADVKLDALCKIEAARRVKGKKLARPFWLVGTAAEEVGLRGATRLSASELFKKIAPSAVLCGEPSELGLIRAHKGYAVVKCTVLDAQAPLVACGDLDPELEEPDYGLVEKVLSGKAAHSSTPKLGANAIHKALGWLARYDVPVVGIAGGAAPNVVPARCALKVPAPNNEPADETRMLKATQPQPDLRRALQAVAALEELWKQLIAAQKPALDESFDPPEALGAMNVIDGGPFEGKARVRGTFDARLLPEHDPDRLIAAFREQAQAQLAKTGQGLALEISVERNAGGMALGADVPLVQSVAQTLKGLGLDDTPRAKPTSTEAGVFTRVGVPSIVIGPGKSTANAHSANERIEIAQLEKAIDLYEALILSLCS